ncbi:SET methyltransferase domain containing protein [Nitzschia inconspicua]|uniref:SET methyltransferase domain containing protein n=1 Tax=Nitzschia inconspicua TaxID=303405 RepID=A0A9K3KVG3_9STRA|nr:SET methyltransferase domain containing protein [Nitzschia inconspicua]
MGKSDSTLTAPSTAGELLDSEFVVPTDKEEGMDDMAKQQSIIQNVSPSASSSPNRKRRKTISTLEGVGVSRNSPNQKDIPSSTNESRGRGEGRTGGREKKNKSKQQDKEDMTWICAECKEADCGLVTKQQTLSDSNNGTDPSNQLSAPEDSFLICDGACHRIFHVPCAGLSQIPDTEEDWLCKDCTRKEHACAFCSQYGKDFVDVFPCQDEICGLFFHESCLQTHHVEYEYDSNDETLSTTANSTSEDEDLEEEVAKIPLFTCPAHQCWTCTQKDMIQLEKEEEAAQRSQSGSSSAKKNKRKKKKQSIFQSKPGRLFQCLYCPTAYHVTCLPPVSRFHELAVLCHEHAMSHRLPELDMSDSIQSQLEDKADQTFMRIHGIRTGSNKRNKGILSVRGASANQFFPGLRGDRLDSKELEMLRIVKETASVPEATQYESITTIETVSVQSSSTVSMVLDGDLPFCLPVDMKDEVYSKPPPYMHIQSLKYDADKSNRPKKILSNGTEEQEKCSCTKSCSDGCFNRLTMAECTGPANCNLGATDCGNRSLGKRQFVKCQPKRERGKGWGLATLEFIPKGKLVQEYMGEVINEAEKERRLISWNEEHPNDPNFYVMALSGGYYVDAREYANLARFINHSCDPNCKVSSINVKGYIRNGIYSIRDIQPGEFLSYDYHFDTNQGDRFVCRCGAANCRGTMKGHGKDGSTKQPATWKEAKARYDADKKFLEEAEKSRVVSLVDTLLPCAEHPNETIASGPLLKHRQEAIRGRIFLWRNLKHGSDFVSRNSRLEKKAVVAKTT